MAQRLINSDLVMQWTRSMAQRGWYLHFRLGGISVVFARYSLVFASGGGFSMMSMNVTSNDELKKVTQKPGREVITSQNARACLASSKAVFAATGDP